MDRREWIGWLLATGTVGALGELDEHALLDLGTHAHVAAGGSQPPRARRTPALRVLSAADARTVTVITEHIIPRTDTPGATDARVTAFIDHMLANWYAPQERDAFLAGLPDIDTRARAAHGARFTMIIPAQQLVLLEALDGEVAMIRRTDPRAANAHWFGTLKYLTVFGYCTSEPGMTQHLHSWPLAGRYDGNAPVRR